MPGGVVELPPERVRNDVARRLPDFPLEEFDRIASRYKIEVEHDGEMPAAVRDKLENLRTNAVILRRDLLLLREESHGALWEGAYQVGRPNVVEDAIEVLQALSNAALAAHNATLDAGIKRGRPQGAAIPMALSLASRLGRTGRTVDKRPNGDLAFLVGKVFESYGHDVIEVRKVVERALDTIEKSGGN